MLIIDLNNYEWVKYMWIEVQNPSDEMLDKLWKEANDNIGPCHDCGVEPGQKHLDGCDTARCLICGGQRLGCDCEEGYGDVWDGMWPGTEYCYKNKLVVKWGENGNLTFDYNREAMMNRK